MVRMRLLSIPLLLAVSQLASAQLSFQPDTLSQGGLFTIRPRNIEFFNCDTDDGLELVLDLEGSLMILDDEQHEYQPFEHFPTSSHFQSILPADINGDGFDDVVLGGDVGIDTSIAILEATGEGGFITHLFASTIGTPVDVADLDGDQDLDILGSVDGDLAWFENTGDWDFTTHMIPSSTRHSWGLLAGDWDDDGDNDLFQLCDLPPDSFAIYSNDGAGNFTVARFPLLLTLLLPPFHLQTVRNEPDGAATILAIGTPGEYVMSFTRLSDGTWQMGALDIQAPYEVGDAADMDGDGLYDFMVCEDWATEWFRQSENGNFENFVLPVADASWKLCNLVDLNDNGRPDLIGCVFEGGSLHLAALMNLGPANAPGSFDLLAPANETTVEMPVTFRWGRALPSSEADEIVYELVVSRNLDFSHPELNPTLEDTSYTVTLRYDESTYFWKVTAREVHTGLSTRCNEIGSFQTEDMGWFDLLTPVNGMNFIREDAHDIVFSWDASDLAGDSASVLYDLSIHTIELPTPLSLTVESLSTTSCTLDLVDSLDLTHEDPYVFEWQVTAHSETRTTVSRDNSTFWVWHLLHAPEQRAVESPTRFGIESAMPNPFNPSTTLSITLPHAGHLRVNVFDLLGRRVTTLIDANRTALHQTLLFDGRHLSSGIYLVHATLDGAEASTMKVVLMK